MDSGFSAASTIRPRSARRGALGVDQALVHLVRVVLADDWTAPTAARRLLDLTGEDHALLRRVRARVWRGSTDGATPVTERALVTLDLAVAATGSP